MIGIDDLCALLDGLGVDWVNEQYANGEEPTPPYICLTAGYEETAYADNKAYARWMPYEILLYTRTRDYALEKRIAQALDDAECAYSKTITHYDGEHLIEASFSVSVTE